MPCFADFDVPPPGQWHKATGGFDMLGSGRHKIETQEACSESSIRSLGIVTQSLLENHFFEPFEYWKKDGKSSRTIQSPKQEQFQNSMMVRRPDQDSFAQSAGNCGDVKEIGQRDCKTCLAADSCLVYILDCFIGLYRHFRTTSKFTKHCQKL